MLVAGIDEAGRGPVIGPLVISCVVIDEKKLRKLEELGVKDSKLLTSSERKKIYEELKKIVDEILLEVVPPSIVDKYVFNSSLNKLELEIMVKLIKKCRASKIYIDSPSANANKIKEMLVGSLDKKVKIIVEVKADRKYPVVSAASIVAKVVRDFEIEEIKKKVGVDFGSGYPSDPRTQKAIKENYNELKEFIRKSWKTVRLAKQKTLTLFFRHSVL